MVEQSTADWHHLDVMDGIFVPNISFGIPVIKAVNANTTKTLDVHLMIVDPDRFIDQFKNAGADVLTVHYEACNHLHRTIHAIKDAGMKAGVALNPHTSVDVLRDTINDIDLVLIMSVNPGFGGQKFIERTFEKVRAMKKLIADSGSTAMIEIDGGVTSANADRLVEAGADVLVAGSFVFRSEDPTDTIASLKDLS